MMKDIELIYKGETHSIPNRWDAMNYRQYIRLVGDFLRMAAGELSAGEVRINWLCDIMGWNKRRFHSEEQIANLVAISEQLTFMFQINYPDNNSVLDGVDEDTYELCRRIDPYRLNIPLARVLRRLDNQYVIDLCFCAQLIPSVQIDGRSFPGYRIETSFGTLTCSLTALQYVEAQGLIERGEESLPLLAAILYYPEKEYNSERAHELANDFAKLPLETSCLIADIRNFKSVIRVLNRHSEVTVRIDLRLRDHTVTFILLHDVSHNDGTICLAKNVTRNTLLLRKGRRCATQSKYNRRSILYVVHNG